MSNYRKIVDKLTFDVAKDRDPRTVIIMTKLLSRHVIQADKHGIATTIDNGVLTAFMGKAVYLTDSVEGNYELINNDRAIERGIIPNRLGSPHQHSHIGNIFEVGQLDGVSRTFLFNDGTAGIAERIQCQVVSFDSSDPDVLQGVAVVLIPPQFAGKTVTYLVQQRVEMIDNPFADAIDEDDTRGES